MSGVERYGSLSSKRGQVQLPKVVMKADEEMTGQEPSSLQVTSPSPPLSPIFQRSYVANRVKFFENLVEQSKSPSLLGPPELLYVSPTSPAPKKSKFSSSPVDDDLSPSIAALSVNPDRSHEDVKKNLFASDWRQDEVDIRDWKLTEIRQIINVMISGDVAKEYTEKIQAILDSTSIPTPQESPPSLIDPTDKPSTSGGHQNNKFSLASHDLPKIDMTIQSDEYKALIRSCGDPTNRSFKEPWGQNRHFGRVTGERRAECLPCGIIMQDESNHSVRQSFIDKHFNESNTHLRRVADWGHWVNALKLELIENSVYDEEELQKCVNSWKLTREGDDSHYEKCTSQKCNTCGKQLNLQFIDVWNETEGLKIRITLNQLLKCKDFIVLYFSTCLLHRFVKYIGATTTNFSRRCDSTINEFRYKRKGNPTDWVAHFRDYGEEERTVSQNVPYLL